MALSKPQQLRARPYFYITEQPASSMLRFRYPSEGMSGSIIGASSTPERPTVPAIKICDYVGLVHITMSCVTKDEPFRPHPHKLVGPRCDRGVYSICTEITTENNVFHFRNVGIQCVTRCKVGEALRIRQELGVDPFHTGFSHQDSRQTIDMSAVRLAFQVRLLCANGLEMPLRPVASCVVHDKKSSGELYIKYPSHRSGPACGGTQVTVLSEKVSLTNIVVVFCQDDEQMWWEEEAKIEIVHRQFTIVFHTPPYLYSDITNKVEVRFFLRRPSDGATSNSLPYTYHPNSDVPEYLDSKVRKPLNTSLIASAHKQSTRSRPRHSSASPVSAVTPYAYSQDRASYLTNRGSSSVTSYNVPTPIERPIHNSATFVTTVMNSAVSSTTHLINCERSFANTVCGGESSTPHLTYGDPSIPATWQKDASPTERPIHSSATLMDTAMNSVVSSTAYFIHNNPASFDTLYRETPSTEHLMQSGLSSVVASRSVATSPAHLWNYGPLSMDTLDSVTSPTSHPFQNDPASGDSLQNVAYSTEHPMYNGPSSVYTLNSAVSPTAHLWQNDETNDDVDAMYCGASSSGHLIHSRPTSVDALHSVASSSAHLIHSGPKSVDALHSVASASAHLIHSRPTSVDAFHSVASTSAHLMQSRPTSVDALHSVASSSAHLMHSRPTSVDALHSEASSSAHLMHSGRLSVPSAALDSGSHYSQNDYIQASPSRELQSPPTSWESNQLLNYLQHYSQLLDDVNDFINEINDENSIHDYSSECLPSPN